MDRQPIGGKGGDGGGNANKGWGATNAGSSSGPTIAGNTLFTSSISKGSYASSRYVNASTSQYNLMQVINSQRPLK